MHSLISLFALETETQCSVSLYLPVPSNDLRTVHPFSESSLGRECVVIPGFLGNAKFFKILLFRIERSNTVSHFMSITDKQMAVKSKMFAKYGTWKRFKQFCWKGVLLFCRRLVWWSYFGSFLILLLYVYVPNCTVLTLVGLSVQREAFLAAFHCYFSFFLLVIGRCVQVSFSLANGETLPWL
jgi:hypothetical protein